MAGGVAEHEARKRTASGRAGGTNFFIIDAFVQYFALSEG